MIVAPVSMVAGFCELVEEVSPLIPEEKWDWFCLDNVLYHDKIITIFWDKYGTRYNHGKGLHILVDGKEIANINSLNKIKYEF